MAKKKTTTTANSVRKQKAKRAKGLVTDKNFETLLITSTAQAREIARGERAPARMYAASAKTIRVAEPRAFRRNDVMRVRRILGVSQQVFANLLGRSGAAVRAWELPNSGKEPDGAASRLLEIFERYPEIAYELMERRRISES